jgi:hypothetical protein
MNYSLMLLHGIVQIATLLIRFVEGYLDGVLPIVKVALHVVQDKRLRFVVQK